MKLLINSVNVLDWPPAVWKAWNNLIVPTLAPNEYVTKANYFRPRPFVDEFNTGSSKWGFVYTKQPGNKVMIAEEEEGNEKAPA